MIFMERLLRGPLLRALLVLFISVVTLFPSSASGTDAGESEVVPGKVYVIPLRGDVDRYLGVFLGRSLETAKRAGAELVIIEIDTFGGRVDTALEIASRIGAASWARTVAYVPADNGGRGVSWSAGALMAFSCSEIWMAPGTSMGAAAPVYQTSEGMEAAGEKTVSAVRGQIAALAEKNGYPVPVALAMVDADIVLKEVVIDGAESLVTAADVEEMERKGIDFQLGRTVLDSGKLLTLTAGEMERYGVSSGTVSTRDELIASYGYSPEDTVVLEKSRSDSLISFLTSGAVTSILLIAGLVALYLEITSPGFGIPGTIALICFTVVFSVSGLMGNLGPAEILMFLLGVVLLLLEIFIIPGFGIAGIAGFLLLLGSFVFSMQNFYWPEFDWQWTIAWKNIGIVGTAVLGGIVLIGVIMAVLPGTGLFNRLVLNGPEDPGYAGNPRPSGRRKRNKTGESRQSPPGDSDNNLISEGSTGIAITDLRPVGKVRIKGKTVVAETDGEYIEKGTEITVQRIDGVKTVVSAREE